MRKKHLKGIFSLILLAILGLSFTVVAHALPEIQIQRGINTPTVIQISNVDADRLLEKGQLLYQESRFSEAVRFLEQARKFYNSNNDLVKQALVGNYLAAAYEKLGEWEAAKKAIGTSLQLLKSQSTSNPEVSQVLARIYNTKGKIELASGETENALASWQEAFKFYSKINHENGIIGSKINQAQALKNLGLYNQALKILEDSEISLKKQPNTLIKATALRSLGNTYRLIGKLETSQKVLLESLAIVQQLNLPQNISATLLSLGNTKKAIGNSKRQYQANIVEQSPLRAICQKTSSEAEVIQHYQTAAKYYQQAADKSPSSIGKTQAEINRLRVLLEIGKLVDPEELQKIKYQLTQLPASRSSVYATVNFVQSYTCFQQKTNQTNSWLTEIVPLLNTAIRQSKILEDKRAESYALGILGQIYEYNQQWDIAKQYTNSALNIAQKINADDIIYQWNWQLGRILTQTGEDKEKAIASYQEAFKSLQKIRSNLVTLNPDVQYIFREEVEPIYRKLVDLLLQPNQGVISQENLQQARNVMESLQLAELDNFFQDACLNAKPVKIDQVDRTAAVIYPIILPERLDVIVSLPGKSLIYHSNIVPQSQVEITIDTLQSYFRDSSRTKAIQPLANQLYRWLIQPFESEFTEIKTLVFVLDGSLRNIPMAVLYDEQQKYLIEKYAVAIAPGLQLIEPKTLPQKLNALIAGLSEEREFQGNTFSALENVPKELQAIQSVIPTEQLLNDRPLFNQDNLQTKIKSANFNVVHLATHGQFSSNPDETFILTWENVINVRDLDKLLRFINPNIDKNIELLVLSACETAAGDKRAALGLAGVAVRAGARSTLATLWQVNDESTAALMSEFYQQLKNNPKITKTEALQLAQKKLWDNQEKDWKRPYFWAAYVLIGNWL